MDYIYEALSYIADSFYLIRDFIFGIADFFSDAATYLVYLALKLYIEFKISTVNMAYSIATQLLGDYEIYSVITRVFNALPGNLRYAAFQFGVVDALRIVIDAYGTAFILRFLS